MTGLPVPGPPGTAVADQVLEADDFADDDTVTEDLGDEAVTAAPADVEPAVEEFEPRPPRSEEPIPLASSELAPIPSSPDRAPASSPVESAERSDPRPPEHS
jgi:hypothetical protein